MQFTIEMHRGEDALKLIGTVDFREQLEKLNTICPWSTVFQSLPFLDAWFCHYNASFEPLVVAGFDEQRNLVGMVPLAVERESGKLVFAGRHHAEYQVWLALPELGADFIEAALESLRKVFPRGRLQIFFLRPDAPLESFRPGGRWSGSCEIRIFPRPLMALGDGSKIRESLNKKSNKSRFKRLEKLGTLQFQHVERFEDLEAEFDEIITFSDFRKGAVYGKLPFRDDPCKKSFYASLLRIPGFLHVSVLRLNGKIISAHMGARDRDQVMLGIITHSPFLAEHSPGKLHLLLLGIHLAEQGFREFDLTPGGTYKDRFATHHDDAFVLTIFFSRVDRALYKAKLQISDIGKRLLQSMSLQPERAREILGNVRRNAVPSRIRVGMRSGLFKTREMKLYGADIRDFLNLENSGTMRRDDLHDLMAFHAATAGNPSIHEFMSAALTRLEAGHHAYTRVSDHVLVCSGWLAGPLITLEFDEVGQSWQVPEGGAALYGFQSHSGHRKMDFQYDAFVQMLHEASTAESATRAYVPVPADDQMTSRLVERLGFRHEASFFQRRTLHQVVRWSTLQRNLTDINFAAPGPDEFRPD
jgi:hypothetical protein